MNLSLISVEHEHHSKFVTDLPETEADTGRSIKQQSLATWQNDTNAHPTNGICETFSITVHMNGTSQVPFGQFASI